ncbi:hypothetical protein OF83DRAFT_1279001 [Amylostereum chailletii]|nr:hypothetical protein OF83DRAFT_1279001 [Amylostereum chailletii]
MAVPGDGGLIITPLMRKLLATLGLLATNRGGQRLRDLYIQQSMHFNPARLNSFAFACYTGTTEAVIKEINEGTAPPLEGTETPFKFGYVALVIAGNQRLRVAPLGSGQHVDVLKVLLAHGCPPDVEDICRYTALDHASMVVAGKDELIRILLERGAQPNHQNIYGMTPIAGAIMAGNTLAVDLLMEFGADLTISDADGTRSSDIYVTGGPQVPAVISKWLRARQGTTAPRAERMCEACGKTSGSLKQCSACHTVLYCSTVCQRGHWKKHKPSCKPFSAANTATLKPLYMEHGTIMPTAPLARAMAGIPAGIPHQNHNRASQQAESYPKSVVIKIQIPQGGSQGPFLIYTKKRDFVCHAVRHDIPDAYDRVAHVVRTKGVGGLKGYFAAELRGADELVVKVSELLAEQPF